MTTFNDDADLLKKFMTSIESCVYGYDIDIKGQSSPCKRQEEPRPKKVHQVRSNVSVLLTVFFDYNCVVYYEFLPQGRTVNKEYYREVKSRLREEILISTPDNRFLIKFSFLSIESKSSKKHYFIF